MSEKIIDLIKHKRSNVLDKLPQPEQLEYGELAVNYNADNPFLSLKDSDGKVIKLSTGGGDDPDAVKFDKNNNVPLRENTKILGADDEKNQHELIGLSKYKGSKSLTNLRIGDNIENSKVITFIPNKSVSFSETTYLRIGEYFVIRAEGNNVSYAYDGGVSWMYLCNDGKWSQISLIVEAMDGDYTVLKNDLPIETSSTWGFNSAFIDSEILQIGIGAKDVHLHLNTNDDPTYGLHITADTPKGIEQLAYISDVEKRVSLETQNQWYLDSENGDDNNDGRTFATSKKTFNGLISYLDTVYVSPLVNEDLIKINLAPGNYKTPLILSTADHPYLSMAIIFGDEKNPSNCKLNLGSLYGLNRPTFQGVEIMADEDAPTSWRNSFVYVINCKLSKAVWVGSGRANIFNNFEIGTSYGGSYGYGRLIAEGGSIVYITNNAKVKIAKDHPVLNSGNLFLAQHSSVIHLQNTLEDYSVEDGTLSDVKGQPFIRNVAGYFYSNNFTFKELFPNMYVGSQSETLTYSLPEDFDHNRICNLIVTDHSLAENRNSPDAHSIKSITGLDDILEDVVKYDKNDNIELREKTIILGKDENSVEHELLKVNAHSEILTLNNVPIGYNLRGKTVKFDTSINKFKLPIFGEEIHGGMYIEGLFNETEDENIAFYLAYMIATGRVFILYTGGTMDDMIHIATFDHFNEEENYAIWNWNVDSVTFPDDRDYIVSNNACNFIGDSEYWGWERATIVDEFSQVNVGSQIAHMNLNTDNKITVNTSEGKKTVAYIEDIDRIIGDTNALLEARIRGGL